MAKKLSPPFTGPRTTGDMNDSHVLECPSCGFTSVIENWDVMSACDGNVICPECIEEVDVITGKTAEPCGDCEFCDCD